MGIGLFQKEALGCQVLGDCYHPAVADLCEMGTAQNDSRGSFWRGRRVNVFCSLSGFA